MKLKKIFLLKVLSSFLIFCLGLSIFAFALPSAAVATPNINNKTSDKPTPPKDDLLKGEKLVTPRIDSARAYKSNASSGDIYFSLKGEGLDNATSFTIELTNPSNSKFSKTIELPDDVSVDPNGGTDPDGGICDIDVCPRVLVKYNGSNLPVDDDKMTWNILYKKAYQLKINAFVDSVKLATSPVVSLDFAPPVVSAPTFNDISKLSADRRNAINAIAKIKITQGGACAKPNQNKKCYNPTGVVNRGAMAEFMRSTVGSPETGKNPKQVSDLAVVASNTGRQNAIKWLAAEEVTAGKQNGSYKYGGKTYNCSEVSLCYQPANSVNRGAMAEFIWNLAGKPEVNQGLIDTGKEIITGDDAKTVNNTQRENAIYWFAALGITKGSACKTDKKKICYKPADPVNRGAMAEFLNSYYKIIHTTFEKARLVVQPLDETTGQATTFLNTSFNRHDIESIKFTTSAIAAPIPSNCQLVSDDATSEGIGSVYACESNSGKDITVNATGGAHFNIDSSNLFANLPNLQYLIGLENINDGAMISIADSMFANTDLYSVSSQRDKTPDQAPVMLSGGFGINITSSARMFSAASLPAAWNEFPEGFCRSSTNMSYMFSESILNSNIDWTDSITANDGLPNVKVTEMFADTDFNSKTIKVDNSSIQSTFINSTSSNPPSTNDIIVVSTLKTESNSGRFNTGKFLGSSFDSDEITKITFLDQIPPVADPAGQVCQDVSTNGDGAIKVCASATATTDLQLSIYQKGGVRANPNSSYLFAGLPKLTAIENLDTNLRFIDLISDMSYMFSGSLIPDSLILPDNFGKNTSIMKGTFANTNINVFPNLPADFGSNATNIDSFLEEAYVAKSLKLPDNFGNKVQSLISCFKRLTIAEDGEDINLENILFNNSYYDVSSQNMTEAFKDIVYNDHYIYVRNDIICNRAISNGGGLRGRILVNYPRLKMQNATYDLFGFTDFDRQYIETIDFSSDAPPEDTTDCGDVSAAGDGKVMACSDDGGVNVIIYQEGGVRVNANSNYMFSRTPALTEIKHMENLVAIEEIFNMDYLFYQSNLLRNNSDDPLQLPDNFGLNAVTATHAFANALNTDLTNSQGVGIVLSTGFCANVRDASNMFRSVKIPVDFVFPDGFLANVTNATSMFEQTKFEGDVVFPINFGAKLQTVDAMFKNAYVGGDIDWHRLVRFTRLSQTGLSPDNTMVSGTTFAAGKAMYFANISTLAVLLMTTDGLMIRDKILFYKAPIKDDQNASSPLSGFFGNNAWQRQNIEKIEFRQTASPSNSVCFNISDDTYVEISACSDDGGKNIIVSTPGGFSFGSSAKGVFAYLTNLVADEGIVGLDLFSTDATTNFSTMFKGSNIPIDLMFVTGFGENATDTSEMFASATLTSSVDWTLTNSFPNLTNTLDMFKDVVWGNNKFFVINTQVQNLFTTDSTATTSQVLVDDTTLTPDPTSWVSTSSAFLGISSAIIRGNITSIDFSDQRPPTIPDGQTVDGVTCYNASSNGSDKVKLCTANNTDLTIYQRGGVKAPTDCTSLFDSLSSLDSSDGLKHLENLKTSFVEYADYMFSSAVIPANIHFPEGFLSNVTDFNLMFYDVKFTSSVWFPRDFGAQCYSFTEMFANAVINEPIYWNLTTAFNNVDVSSMFQAVSWGTNGKILVANESVKTLFTASTTRISDPNKIVVSSQ